MKLLDVYYSFLYTGLKKLSDSVPEYSAYALIGKTLVFLIWFVINKMAFIDTIYEVATSVILASVIVYVSYVKDKRHLKIIENYSGVKPLHFLYLGIEKLVIMAMVSLFEGNSLS